MARISERARTSQTSDVSRHKARRYAMAVAATVSAKTHTGRALSCGCDRASSTGGVIVALHRLC